MLVNFHLGAFSDVAAMPTQVTDDQIKTKVAYNGEVLVLYLQPGINYDKLCSEMRDVCRFTDDQVFTTKWVDDEGDPCIISTQMELDEALRLYEINKDSQLTIHGKSV